MAERRSLGAAINLSPEKRAFIQGGPVSPKAAPAMPAVEAKAEDVVEPAEQPKSQVERAVQLVRRSRSRRHARAPVPQGDQMPLGTANLLAQLTTRLQPTTFAALKRAGLERKLRGQSPDTVQEIAEEAIQEWLIQAGYLE